MIRWIASASGQRGLQPRRVFGLRAIQLEVMGLVGLRVGVELPAGALAHARSPRVDQALDDPLDGLCVLVVGAEVPGLGECRAVGVQPFGQAQIPGERL
jgi:hypothetical protein